MDCVSINQKQIELNDLTIRSVWNMKTMESLKGVWKPAGKIHPNALVSCGCFPPGVSDELCVPGALDVCPAVSATSADGLQCIICVGVCDGGVQDDVSAQSHQATGVFLQLHSCGCLHLTLGRIHQLLQTNVFLNTTYLQYFSQGIWYWLMSFFLIWCYAHFWCFKHWLICYIIIEIFWMGMNLRKWNLGRC